MCIRDRYYAVDELNTPMGTITVGLQKKENSIYLYIKDEGKGLEPEHIKNIFKRSYRVDTKKTGTGLGLSIVKQIALLHEASVKAYNDEGLVISINFSKLFCVEMSVLSQCGVLTKPILIFFKLIFLGFIIL